MPPTLAIFAYSVLGLALLRWSKGLNGSRVLWIAVIWLVIISSRLPSQWLGLVPMTNAEAFVEGSPLDRTIYTVLMLVALWILINRKLDWAEIFGRNFPLVLFLLFALASVVWSDFTYISFKRWFRDLGLYVMMLLVLTDRSPLVAMSLVIRRFSYILLFWSLILIKYYPYLGISYDAWTGGQMYVGATTSKNMLGVVCLISGLFYFWDTLAWWPERRTREAKRALVANVILIAITLRLLSLSNSATSQGCLIIGCIVMAIVRSKWATANPQLVTAGIPVVLAAYAVLESVFDVSTTVAALMGRDATLHGRTGIWDVILKLQTNPLFGVGYQSFWMGDRLTAVWSGLNTGFLNEAHNGYLEIYLSLGLIGVTLIVIFLMSSFRTVCRQLTVSPHFASFGVALWVVTVFYNFTEAALGTTLLWSALLFCVIVVPRTEKILSLEASRVEATSDGLRSRIDRLQSSRHLGARGW